MTEESTLGTETSSPTSIFFYGRLASMTIDQAREMIHQLGGASPKVFDDSVQLVVMGEGQESAEHRLDPILKLPEMIRREVESGRVNFQLESQFWPNVGLVDTSNLVQRLYTLQMLASLLKIDLKKMRHWYRHGLLLAYQVVHKLPYFDFQQVTAARCLDNLTSAGASIKLLKKWQNQFRKQQPEIENPFAELPLEYHGHQIVWRKGEHIVDREGQLHFDFELDEEEEAPLLLEEIDPFDCTLEDYRLAAEDYEENGDWRAACDCYRAGLEADRGQNVELHFALAECLYRLGDISAARERYYVAIELDEEFVEARANLGCILLEEKEYDLAKAAFEGALASHAEYPDAHFHLARTLEEMKDASAALEHWQAFIDLSPDSPWADEARDRIASIHADQA